MLTFRRRFSGTRIDNAAAGFSELPGSSGARHRKATGVKEILSDLSISASLVRHVNEGWVSALEAFGKPAPNLEIKRRQNNEIHDVGQAL